MRTQLRLLKHPVSPKGVLLEYKKEYKKVLLSVCLFVFFFLGGGSYKGPFPEI